MTGARFLTLAEIMDIAVRQGATDEKGKALMLEVAGWLRHYSPAHIHALIADMESKGELTKVKAKNLTRMVTAFSEHLDETNEFGKNHVN